MCRARAGMWVYAALVLIGAFSIALIGWQLREQNQQIDEVAMANQQALCALRNDLERREETTERFLQEHPNGIPGISSQQLQESLENQRRTIRALRFIECP
jgi:predicted negative regulator of RcsB-dependent stress response